MQIDSDLLKSCIAQNRDAQKQLYQLLLPYLRPIAIRYLRDRSYVKDALQESFIKIFKSIKNYDCGKASINSWASRITINCCLNYNKRVIGLPQEALEIETHQPIVKPYDGDWSAEELILILKKMPPDYFEVFNLFVIDGYKHEEIALQLNISEALSRKRLSRARAWVNKTFLTTKEWIAQFNLSSFSKN